MTSSLLPALVASAASVLVREPIVADPRARDVLRRSAVAARTPQFRPARSSRPRRSPPRSRRSSPSRASPSPSRVASSRNAAKYGRGIADLRRDRHQPLDREPEIARARRRARPRRPGGSHPFAPRRPRSPAPAHARRARGGRSPRRSRAGRPSATARPRRAIALILLRCSRPMKCHTRRVAGSRRRARSTLRRELLRAVLAEVALPGRERGRRPRRRRLPSTPRRA